MTNQPSAMMIAGPTASGKSAVSLALAAKYEVEIISMDSALVYRGMDIGSAKPTPEERSVCPHHLIDIRDIGESYSAADFLNDTRRLVGEIASRGRFTLIVGGTMLYAKALREGIHEMPGTDADVRAAVFEEGLRLGWPAMHALLDEVDHATASRLAPNDSQRISRALEVYRMTGTSLSEFHARPATILGIDVIPVGLMPAHRPRLHQRIEERFDGMLEEGFLDEVKGLMAREDFDENSPAMRAVGYRQAILYLKGEVDFERFHLSGVAATRQLAKRQMTWMRSMPDLKIFDPEDPETLPSIEAMLRPYVREKIGS